MQNRECRAICARMASDGEEEGEKKMKDDEGECRRFSLGLRGTSIREALLRVKG